MSTKEINLFVVNNGMINCILDQKEKKRFQVSSIYSRYFTRTLNILHTTYSRSEIFCSKGKCEASDSASGKWIELK